MSGGFINSQSGYNLPLDDEDDLKKSHFDATGGTSGMDISNLMNVQQDEDDIKDNYDEVLASSERQRLHDEYS